MPGPARQAGRQGPMTGANDAASGAGYRLARALALPAQSEIARETAGNGVSPAP